MSDAKVNLKCFHCGKVYSSLKAVCAHVTQAHQKKFESSDFDFTNEKALPLTYGKSRSKDAMRAEFEINKLAPNFECVHCRKVFGSRHAIAGHITMKHKKLFDKTDYVRTAKEALPIQRKTRKMKCEQQNDRRTDAESKL